MVTGASTADLAVILIDARNGTTEQTLRHSYIASLLAIPYIIVCINKMDLVDFSEAVFENIKLKYKDIIDKLHLKDVKFIPISAKLGDNVVDASANMPWYTGDTLMNVLETTTTDRESDSAEMRFPVQYVIRPVSDKFHDFRGYAGRLSGGVLRKGAEVVVMPSGRCSTVVAISQCDKELDEAFTPDSVTVRLADDIDVSRGDIIVNANEKPSVSQDIRTMVCWFNENPLHVNNRYIIMHATKETVGIVKTIENVVNINTLELEPGGVLLNMNEIASIQIKTAQPLVFDSYRKNRTTGSLIFIDPDTFETVGAGMIM
jgi:sulfate adenylyltransferase subunit 1